MQRIHIKYKVLFSLKTMKKCSILSSAAVVMGALKAGLQSIKWLKINRIYDGVEAETRKSQASFQIILSYARLAEHKT